MHAFICSLIYSATQCHLIVEFRFLQLVKLLIKYLLLLLMSLMVFVLHFYKKIIRIYKILNYVYIIGMFFINLS